MPNLNNMVAAAVHLVPAMKPFGSSYEILRFSGGTLYLILLVDSVIFWWNSSFNSFSRVQSEACLFGIPLLQESSLGVIRTIPETRRQSTECWSFFLHDK